jgi:signal transduction histidine kinase
MEAPSIAPPVRPSARWTSATRAQRRRRPAYELRPRPQSDTTHPPDRPARRAIARVLVLAVAVVALADILADIPPLGWLSWVLGVIVAGLAALLSAAAAEPAGVDHTRRRWQWQAVASASVMFMLMAGGPSNLGVDVLWFAIVIAAASALIATATTFREEAAWGIGSLCLALDAAIVGFTALLTTLALGNPLAGAGAAVLLGAFAAAGYAIAVATRPTVRDDPYGADALLLGGVGVLCLYVAGIAARQMAFAVPGMLATSGVALFGALGLARSAWRGQTAAARTPPSLVPESRLRLMPALAAGGAIVGLSWAELSGQGSRTSFFGVIVLFGLIIGRLLITLVENRQLLQRVERSGVFEEKLRDLGGALIAALDRKDTLELVCRAAQMSLRADSVILWMLDAAADELEAVEVLSSKRSSLLRRRLAMDDPTSLAVRVARTRSAEIVLNVPASNHSNAFLNVLLHAQALLAVPVMRAKAVQGVLVCVDSRNPSAYSAGELAKAELLASQVSVALDNAYQHALQRRRLEELSALYQFAQSAHAALSSAEIVRQLLPILKERLGYTYAAIWLREERSGALRLAAGDGPGGGPRGLRPSPLALRAFANGGSARAGLDWDDSDSEPLPLREDSSSQLAVPMVLKRRVVGVVDLESRHPQAYSPTEERLLVALVNHAALAMDNLHLLEETRKVAALRELDRMKTELLGTVSHELRTPLGSIKGYATTLLTHGNRLKRDEQREFLHIIDSEADRLRELIENLLDMSRLEAGVLRIDREPTRMGEIARDLVRKVQLAAPNHTFELDWATTDPCVAVDARRIYQVIQNLLTNAVKYSPDGGTVRLAARQERHDLVVSVQDEGLGMPASELDRIFDRFHRVGGEVARRIGGTGLGLAICKGLVDAHGGRIWAESDGEGKGSVFKFALPLVPGAEVTGLKGVDDHQEANRTRR